MSDTVVAMELRNRTEGELQTKLQHASPKVQRVYQVVLEALVLVCKAGDVCNAILDQLIPS